MEVREALEQHVRKRLEDSFGRAVGMLIWASADRVSGISSIDPDRAGYMRFVEAVCTDQRVVDMWGKSGADHTLAQWKVLV
jgi:hypothetical protein